MMSETLEDEPVILDSPIQDREHEKDNEADSDSSDEEEDEEVSAKKRFEVIARDLKDDKIDLRDNAKLEQFVSEHGAYLGQKTIGDGDHNTLLHLLIEDIRDKVFDKYQPLVKLLVEKYPEILSEKDTNEKTPLYIAISKKRKKLVRYICKTYKHIDNILGIPCSHMENCIHVAIRRNVEPDLAIYLIKLASEATLCAKDDKGNTPLHLAVEYDKCTDKQLSIVEALIDACDKAIDGRTSAPKYLSPFRYHEHTRIEAKTAADLEAKKAAKEREREAAQGRKDDTSSIGDGPNIGKDIKLKVSIQGADSRKGGAGTKGGQSLAIDTIKPLRRNNTGLEGPGKHGSSSTSSGGQDGYKGDSTKSGISIASSAVVVKSEVTSLTSRTPAALKAEKKKKSKEPKEEAKVTDDSANAIKNHLKLHCMRTRNHDETVEFLYGRTQEKQIYFDLYDSPSLTISEERIVEGLDHLQFEDILQYVALPSLTLEKRPVNPKLKKPSKVDGKGKSDMIFLFKFLRDKGVRRIIRVIVDDTVSPAHSDESIEKSLDNFKVEVWDWKKYDICIDTIERAARDVKEVCLYWSGNNAVLRGWSDESGLYQLKRLEKVHLHVEQGLETTRRMSENVERFLERLAILRPNIKVEIVKEQQPEKHVLAGLPTDSSHEQYEHRHRWLTCMDEFADFIQNVDTPKDLSLEPITIALIDDGVDINEQSLHAKIIGGRSFCQRDKFQNLSKPYYVTSGGHGTVMASLICRVFPKAQLYVVKLDEHISEGNKRQITAKSAAKAVRAAVDKQVDIISMSWTIEKTAANTADVADLETAISAAADAGILMFCAAIDQGIESDKSYPAAGRNSHLFKIGAAEASGAVWKWVGDASEVDFIFPGHKVVKDRPNDAPLERCKTLTGSSVATAFATGLAALVLYCVQLGALNGGSGVSMEDFKAMKGHDRMREAFTAIGTRNKYIEVWDVFEPAAKKAEGMGRERRIEIVAEVAGRLKTRKTFE